MKTKKYWILAPIIVIALILSGCDRDNSEDNSEEAARLEKERQIKKKIQELCSKYNAVTDWKQGIGKKGFAEHTYTIEVENALIRTDGRPILFYGVANDIVKESDKYIVYWGIGFASLLRDPMFGAFGLDVRFVLDCTQNQVEEIMHHSVSDFDDCAVIAQISEVEKVRFKLKGNAWSHEDLSVELEPADIFLAKGKCLDLLFVVGKPKDE